MREIIRKIPEISSFFKKNDMNKEDKIIDKIEWNELCDEEKTNIVIKEKWDPYNPNLGKEIKTKIIDDFITKYQMNLKQIGIKSFGWEVYMLYVVVENSRQRIPRQFLGLTTNKGLIINKTDGGKSKVKFNYGGTFDLDLTSKIVIL